MNGTHFYDTIREAQEFLRISRSEFQTEHVLTNDQLDYLWIMIKGRRVEDILVALNGVTIGFYNNLFQRSTMNILSFIHHYYTTIITQQLYTICGMGL